MSAPAQSTTTPAPTSDAEIIDSIGSYGYGWHDSDAAGQSARAGNMRKDIAMAGQRTQNGNGRCTRDRSGVAIWQLHICRWH